MSADLDLQTLAATATSPSFPLRSAFTASYNMVVNLIGTYGFEEARRFNSLSFAQFQSDLSQKGLSAAIAKNTESQQEFAQDLACHLGDFDAYAQLAADLSKAEKAANAESRTAANSAINAALEQLRTGDVIEVNRGRRRGRALVIAPAVAWPPRIAVLSIDRQVRRVAVGDFAAPPRVLAHIRIREGFNERSTNARKSLAAELATIAVDEQTSPAESTYTIDSSEDAISRMRSALRSHACHGCADRAVHMSAWHAHQRLSKESSVLSAKIAGRQSALTRRFDALCRVLGELGYMDATSELQLLPPGALLAGIHTELDLVTAEVVQQGIFDEVTPAVAAAMGAALTYESRGDEQKPVIMPTDEIRHVLTTIHRAWAKVTEIEGNHQVRQTRPLDFSMVPAMYRWARGGTLANVLHDQEFSAGDFVRACRQCIDLLRHIATSDGVSVATRNAVRGAIHAIDRDLVNASVADQ
jgi:ATP-dependent RNA helicase HelY